MTFTVSAQQLGTPESSWLACRRLRACPPMHWGPPGLAVFFAPHPDDETLAAGGLLQVLGAAGFDVRVVAVTDGEGSHPQAPIAPSALAAQRVAEQDRALARLGVSQPVTRLRRPDGGVRDDAELVAQFVESLEGAVLGLSIWQQDGHPDHDATGRAAAVACTRTGARHVELPVWAWHWAQPDSDDLPWHRARRVDLPEAALALKRAAIAEYRSQIAPLGPGLGEAALLPPAVLARFERPFETVFT